MATDDGRLRPGERQPGRGAWLCRDDGRCLVLAERRRAWGRALRAPVAPGASWELCGQPGFAAPSSEGSAAVCEDGMPGRYVGPARVGAKGS
ncbi:MAG: DUF448 domain-containing protein [Actinomycetota bacterium]|nr:DUF448 domain-containing protein [Actinomycetota bacterium]